MNYYQRHIGDYLRDTSHLSLLEHGVYTRLLDVYYTREACFPADSAAIARLVGARAKDEISALKTVLGEFFTATDSGFTHKRCDAEIAKYQERAATNREVGKLGGRPKKTQTVISDNPDGLRKTEVVGFEKNPNQEPVTNNQEPIKDKGTRRKASLPVPVDWMPKSETEKRAMAEFSLTPELLKRFVVAFQDICQAKGYTYANIDAAFINCIRKDWPGLRTQNGKPAPVVDLEAKREAERMAALDPEARLAEIRAKHAAKFGNLPSVNLRAMP